MQHRIRITQIYRLEREAVIEIEAVSANDAAEKVGIGEIDLPAFDDPVWTEARTFENETCCPA